MRQVEVVMVLCGALVTGRMRGARAGPVATICRMVLSTVNDPSLRAPRLA